MIVKDIEDIIDEFDQIIDEVSVISILDKLYRPSEILKDIDHQRYCKELDKYIEYKQYEVIK